MNSPIDQLVEELWGCCVMQRAAQDQATIERWQTNEIDHLKERFVVQIMPDSLKPLLEKAIAQWEGIEKKLLSHLKMNREQFLQEFEKARNAYLRKNTEWHKFVSSVGLIISYSHPVRNMEWVNLFSWILPAAHPDNEIEHRIRGKMVTSIFYIEQLLKETANPNTVVLGNPLGKIEARWLIVNQNRTIEDRVLLSINKIVKQFQDNPYQFLYESDVQCGLFAELRKNISETVCIPSVSKQGYKYELGLIYSEYRNKIDIVCLNAEIIPSINKSPFKGYDTYIYNLPILVGIELKYVIMGYSKDVSIVYDDYQKLRNLNDIKYRLAICFLQNNEITDPFCESIKESYSIVQTVKKIDGIYIVTPTKILEVSSPIMACK
ncbi:MAG: hypothetical protein HQK78_13685 [Desulfobacterales bacterium]|nr:hypothetical protein [Desulfobacterales bacterium]